MIPVVAVMSLRLYYKNKNIHHHKLKVYIKVGVVMGVSCYGHPIRLAGSGPDNIM